MLPDTVARYYFERDSDRHNSGMPVHEVMDRDRLAHRRVICRTNLQDAKMIADALNRHADTGRAEAERSYKAGYRYGAAHRLEKLPDFDAIGWSPSGEWLAGFADGQVSAL